jgi:hypothetical protein
VTTYEGKNVILYLKKDINIRRLLAAKQIFIIGCLSLLSFNVSAYLAADTAQSSAAATVIKKVNLSSPQNRPLGTVVKYVRTVMLIDNQKSQGTQIKQRYEGVFTNNELHTGLGSKAYIKMVDGSKILLRQNSKLRISNEDSVNVEKGKVMFSVAKRKKNQNSFKVATRVALLGIKGTQFIVEAGDDEQSYKVYLKEGAIVVYPNEKQFKLYQDEQEQDFSDYANTQKNEFETMKVQQQQEFSEYVKEITMTKNKGLSFNGNEVKEVDIPEEVQVWFDEFDDPNIGW